jgi:hypothetical protein
MKYFISYVFYERGRAFFANAEWEGEAITSIEQIQSIEDEIRQGIQQTDKEEASVKILFWRRFHHEPTKE